MKNKLLENPDTTRKPDQEDGHVFDDSTVDSSGPSIAANKKSKMLIIAASSILITLVVYFFFFKTDNNPQEKVKEVPTALLPVPNVAPSDNGKSPFEIDLPKEVDKKNIDDQLIAKPAVPDVPALPKDLTNDSNLASLFPEKNDTTPLQNILKPIIKETVQDSNFNQPEQTTDLKDIVKNPKTSPILVLSGDAGPASSVGYDNNIIQVNGDPIKALQKSKNIAPTFINDIEHTIAQGKLLTAVLETAINTELPGSVRAVVSHDVYGESGNKVLIPKGSRLYGTYSSIIAVGQARVKIDWKRLIRPDGVDAAITSQASDQFGRSGIEGDVDNKYGPTIVQSILTSLLSVAGTAILDKVTGQGSTATVNNATTGTSTTTGTAATQAATNVNQTVTDTVNKIIKDQLNVQPVITVPQGTKITVIVDADLTLPPIRTVFTESYE